MIRVFIVAASPLIRAGVQSMLADSRVDIVGSAADLESISGQLVDVEPDVVLVEAGADTHEELLSTLEDAEIAREYPVIVLSEQIKAAWLSDALRAGVRAILPREVTLEQLRAALEAAAAGLLVVHPSELDTVLPATVGSHAPVDELLEPLTRREREVLQMLAAGLANKEIAARLAISDHTVKFHVASILGKLGVSTRTEAVSLGIRRGLVLL
ncbi:MAG TPA: response regulator transcription factor [Candidatus Polarisedimenticolia bacterium]|nr:response regulator transcription factor [Candidatus Polarisedimenticolia bacterium]